MTLPADILSPNLTTAVLTAMKAATDAEVMPRWRALTQDEVRTKSAEWDLVTDADVEAERRLTVALRDLVDVPVVGEEATAASPELLDLVGSGGPVWIVDPVDGTRNFVAGSEVFGCMVALVDGGRTVGGWITHPAVGRSMHAVRGGGAYVDGRPVTADAPAHPRHLRGSLGSALVAREDHPTLQRAVQLGPVRPVRMCAAWDYADAVTGATDYVTFSLTMPWDHAPGALICQEAGLVSRRLSGAEYLPGDGGSGILTAHPSIWQVVADVLNSPEPSGA